MGKTIVLAIGKCSILGVMIFSAATFMGLPVNDPWFDVLIASWVMRWMLLSIVNGMPEPEVESSPWYIWAYRSLHSMAHVATAYFSHKRMWQYISGEKKEE